VVSSFVRYYVASLNASIECFILLKILVSQHRSVKLDQHCSKLHTVYTVQTMTYNYLIQLQTQWYSHTGLLLFIHTHDAIFYS